MPSRTRTQGGATRAPIMRGDACVREREAGAFGMRQLRVWYAPTPRLVCANSVSLLNFLLAFNELWTTREDKYQLPLGKWVRGAGGPASLRSPSTIPLI